MKRRISRGRALVAATAVGTLTLLGGAGAALASTGHGGTAGASTHVSQQQPTPAKDKETKDGAKDKEVKDGALDRETNDDRGSSRADHDNVQEGDQTAPDGPVSR